MTADCANALSAGLILLDGLRIDAKQYSELRYRVHYRNDVGCVHGRTEPVMGTRKAALP